MIGDRGLLAIYAHRLIVASAAPATWESMDTTKNTQQLVDYVHIITPLGAYVTHLCGYPYGVRFCVLQAASLGW